MKVGISHTTPEEEIKRLLSFAEKLSNNGIVVDLDYYNLTAGDDLYHYMEKLCFNNDFVLLICNNSYEQKANERQGGVGFETRMLSYLSSTEFYNKIIPIIFEKDDNGKPFIPNYAKSKKYIDLCDDLDFKSIHFKYLVNTILSKLPKNNNPDEFWNFDNEKSEVSQFTNLPFHRPNNLVNRNVEVVKKITKYFGANNGLDFSDVKPLLIKGWSGEGKSTILTEFAYKFGYMFDATLYIDCLYNIDNQLSQYFDNVVTSFITFFNADSKKVSDIKNLNQNDEKTKQLKIEFVKKLIEDFKFFIIYDNVNSLFDIMEFFPKKGYSRLCINTTNFNIDNVNRTEVINLEELSVEEALQILLYNVEKDNIKNFEKAEKVCELLGFLPYALELASYQILDYKEIGLDIFINEIIESNENYLKSNNRRFNPIHKVDSIFFLIKNSFDKIKSEFSVGILQTCNALWISNYDMTLDRIITINNIDNNNLINANKELQSIGLIKIFDKKYFVHTLTQDYLKNNILTYNTAFSVLNYLKGHIIENNEPVEPLHFEYYEPLIKLNNDVGFFVRRNDAKEFYSISELLKKSIELSKDDINHSFIIDYYYFLYILSKSCSDYQFALDICNFSLSFIHEAETFLKDTLNFKYSKALMLHFVEEWDEAYELYKEVHNEVREYLIKDGRTPISFWKMMNCKVFMGHINRQFNKKNEAVNLYKDVINWVQLSIEANDKYNIPIELLNILEYRCSNYLQFCNLNENEVLLYSKRAFELYNKLVDCKILDIHFELRYEQIQKESLKPTERMLINVLKPSIE